MPEMSRDKPKILHKIKMSKMTDEFRITMIVELLSNVNVIYTKMNVYKMFSYVDRFIKYCSCHNLIMEETSV